MSSDPGAPAESAILVRHSGPLSGRVRISGAKNSVLKLMAATALAPGRYRLGNVPAIQDVPWTAEILTAMGADVSTGPEPDSLTIVSPPDLDREPPYDLVARMRASIVLLGPLLARFGEARIPLPGGDDFGGRPIDMHLKGLEQLGASLEMDGGCVVGKAERLVGTEIVLDYPSVGATENVLMAAVLAEGTTVLDNAAREPEISDLASFLNKMGARVFGAGTNTITIMGVDELAAVDHVVVPDRLEAATYLAAVGAVGGDVVLEGTRPDTMTMLLEKLAAMGLATEQQGSALRATSAQRLRGVNISTLPYPGVATDYKPMLVALLSLCEGESIVSENVFDGRFRYVDELAQLGANIRTEGHHVVVEGVDRLHGCEVRAHDIRAGAALVIAGLGAEGETRITDPHHIDRGYSHIVDKLRGLGADIERV